MNDFNLIEYADPEIYDLENDEFEPSGPFILEIAQKTGGPILELGCGTGRLTIPLAAHGFDITGLDIVPAMIDRAKEKSQGSPIEWIQADVRDFHLHGTYRLIFESGSVFQHMLTRPDQEAFLARVREHLHTDGLFVVSTIFPHASLLYAVEDEQEWFNTQHPNGYDIKVSGTEFYDAVRQVKVETAHRRWKDNNGLEVVRVAPLSLRYIFPQELEALLHYNGFEVVERYGGYDSAPLTNASRMLIYICRKNVV
jgi:SAM-dependent methyltransferase